jgi:RHS repeat-associated protein
LSLITFMLRYGSGHWHQINLDGLVICDVERDRLHREVLRTQGQLNTRTQYDRAGRLRSRARRTVDQPRQLPAQWATEYDYDPADDLIVQSERNGPRTFRTYLHYDATARLMVREGEPATETELYAYDPAANLLEAQGSGPILHNRLLRYQDKRYLYDGFGRMIEKRSVRRGTQRFIYDAESRLIAVHNDNGDVVRMTYDPLGRRIEKNAYNRREYLVSTTVFTWDGLRLLHEHCHHKQSLYLYVDDSHEPLARIDGIGDFQTVHHFHNAPNGQPEALTEANGDLAWMARYQVWGNTTQEDRAPHVDPQNLRFQGQYLDRETGLHYNTFRFYDPDVGRFTTPDPIGLAGGINLYGYAPNPVGWVDPWGWSCTRVRHYTNRKGLEGIKESGVIKARDNGRVYVEPAKAKVLNQRDAVKKYQIDRSKGRDYVETPSPADTYTAT